MPENRNLKFNNPEQQEIYDLLIDAGVKPLQAFNIAMSPNSTKLSDDALFVMATVVTDDRGYYVVNKNEVSGALGQYGNITDMVNYFASDEGMAEATRLYTDQVSYFTALDNKATYATRVKDYNTRVKDYTKRREEAEAKVTNPLLTAEGKARAQAELAKLDKEANGFTTELQTLNDEYQTFADWGLMNQGFSNRARPELSRASSVYDERGLQGDSGAYYLSKDQMEWGERKLAEEAQMQASEEAGAPSVKYQQDRYNTYRQLGGYLSFENWAKTGQPATAPETMSAIYSRNLPQNLSYNESNWRKNAYGDIYGEFLASEGAPPPNLTNDEALRRETTKGNRFEEFIKKYNYLQKYKGVAPYARGENTGRFSPRTRVLNY